MSEEVNVAAVEQFTERINSGDVDGAVEVFASDAVDHDPAEDQGPGRDGFRTFFTALTSAFPDAQITPATVVTDDDHVCVAYTLSGTHQGTFQGIPATGRSISVRGMQIARFADGQIAERWGSSDELGLLKQIGTNPTA